MKYCPYLIILFFIMVMAMSCGVIPSDSSDSENGTIDLRIWINKPPSFNNSFRETTWDRLVVQISSLDMSTKRDTFNVTMEKSFYSFIINGVSAGENRLMEIWTIDSDGDMIHGKDSITVDLEPSQTVPITSEVHPIKGSLYVILTSIPSEVDSVLFSFTTSDTTWFIKDKKTTKLDLTLDKIPFGSTGTLSIVGYSTVPDTVASWKKEGFTFTNANTTLEASFINVGKINLDVTITIPGVTVIIGIMDTTDSLGDENGGLIISEVMYTANDSEYIEIYNPKTTAFSDTIILQKEHGTFRIFDVNIPPKDFYVIGRKIDSLTPADSTPPWFDTTHTIKSAFDLSSTSGNWITIRAKDSTLLDCVVFQTGSNNQGWPHFTLSKKTSIVLDSLPDDPEYNNYGRNWIQAESYINQATTQQQGTPGESGS